MFTGPAVQASRWGDVQVTIIVKKTTTTNIATKKKTVKRRITAVNVPVYPTTPTARSSSTRGPPDAHPGDDPRTERNIDLVSGATDTSDAFLQSLQAAILKAKGRVTPIARVARRRRRVEHIMGMPIVVDVRDASTPAASTRVRLVPAASTRPSARTARTARSAA